MMKLRLNVFKPQYPGSNPVEVLNFSGGFYMQLHKLTVHNCEDHSLLDFTAAVQYMK